MPVLAQVTKADPKLSQTGQTSSVFDVVTRAWMRADRFKERFLKNRWSSRAFDRFTEVIPVFAAVWEK